MVRLLKTWPRILNLPMNTSVREGYVRKPPCPLSNVFLRNSSGAVRIPPSHQLIWFIRLRAARVR